MNYMFLFCCPLELTEQFPYSKPAVWPIPGAELAAKSNHRGAESNPTRQTMQRIYELPVSQFETLLQL